MPDPGLLRPCLLLQGPQPTGEWADTVDPTRMAVSPLPLLSTSASPLPKGGDQAVLCLGFIFLPKKGVWWGEACHGSQEWKILLF